jgi:predicted metal-dependent enzyme (double-stranded beta helix superfamily)
MTYNLEEFCDDCRQAIADKGDTSNLATVVENLEKLLKNRDFVNEICGPDAETGTHVLYQDPEKEFMVLSHINPKGKTSPPHDHGKSWAIYGQAVQFTEMTEYDRVDKGGEDGKAEVKQSRKYRLDPGMAGIFKADEIHSIHFPDDTRFIRVTGTDLSKLNTKRYDQKNGTVTVIEPNDTGEVSGAASVKY